VKISKGCPTNHGHIGFSRQDQPDIASPFGHPGQGS
jgi:hypothetical protein